MMGLRGIQGMNDETGQPAQPPATPAPYNNLKTTLINYTGMPSAQTVVNPPGQQQPGGAPQGMNALGAIAGHVQNPVMNQSGLQARNNDPQVAQYNANVTQQNANAIATPDGRTEMYRQQGDNQGEAQMDSFLSGMGGGAKFAQLKQQFGNVGNQVADKNVANQQAAQTQMQQQQAAAQAKTAADADAAKQAYGNTPVAQPAKPATDTSGWGKNNLASTGLGDTDPNSKAAKDWTTFKQNMDSSPMANSASTISWIADPLSIGKGLGDPGGVDNMRYGTPGNNVYDVFQSLQKSGSYSEADLNKVFSNLSQAEVDQIVNSELNNRKANGMGNTSVPDDVQLLIKDKLAAVNSNQTDVSKAKGSK